jgi:hypothetical protein
METVENSSVDHSGIDRRSSRQKSRQANGTAACVLTVELERMERQFALAGEASAEDLEIYARVAGNLRRLLEAVGLQRRARNVTPTLDEYLEQQQPTE